MHELIELNDIRKVLSEAERFDRGLTKVVSDLGGLKRAVIKFNPNSICEIFGYQIASTIGVRIPRTQGFWVNESIDSGEVYGEPGSVGILVEHLEDYKHFNRDEAAKIDPEMVARALALCAFDRHEWGEFGLSGGQVYFVDLERLFPNIHLSTLLTLPGVERISALLADEESFRDGIGEGADSYIGGGYAGG